MSTNMNASYFKNQITHILIFSVICDVVLSDMDEIILLLSLFTEV